jgi:hypothetical protein
MRTGLGGLAVLVVAAVALLTAATAGAAGAGAVSFTQHIQNEVLFTDTEGNPCTGDAGTFTATARNGIFHITTLANGTFWATFTAEGTGTFVPDDPAAPSGSGHFAVWDGDNLNLHNSTETSTFNLVVFLSDGSRVTMHETFHMNTSASGGSITFDKPRLTCG